MGPDEKDTGPLTVYMDGQPVGIAGGEIPEISLAEEKPGIYLEGETIDAIRKKAEEMYISEAVFNRELAEAITRAWNNLTDTMAAAAEVFTAWIKTVAEEIQARNELKTAVRWATAPWPTATGTPRKSGPVRSTPSGSWPGIGRRSCKCYG